MHFGFADIELQLIVEAVQQSSIVFRKNSLCLKTE